MLDWVYVYNVYASCQGRRILAALGQGSQPSIGSTPYTGHFLRDAWLFCRGIPPGFEVTETFHEVAVQVALIIHHEIHEGFRPRAIACVQRS
jgi:hypothetical protein